jgi:hypothetical protein
MRSFDLVFLYEPGIKKKYARTTVAHDRVKRLSSGCRVARVCTCFVLSVAVRSLFPWFVYIMSLDASFVLLPFWHV